MGERPGNGAVSWNVVEALRKFESARILPQCGRRSERPADGRPGLIRSSRLRGPSQSRNNGSPAENGGRTP
jgi:hypothetical protein